MERKNPFDLAGKVAIISGGAGLLGTQFAEVLSEAGVHAVIADQDEGVCHEKAAAVTSGSKIKTLGIGVDVTSKKSVEEMVKKAVQEFGKISILINCASLRPEGYFAPMEDYPLELWEKVMAVNLTGTFLCCQAVGKQMVKQGYGSIINMASIYGVVAPDQRIYEGTKINTPVVYSASKGGVLGLTRYLATYWADKGIRVNSITPGGVYDGQAESFVKGYSYRTPMGRMADKRELRGAVLYLASDASSYVTGHNLVVDGGWTVW
ncbi:MAG: SDR family oxidoreductase [Chloroflexi bacterium]|nr:SDR family oxidoreductase [Chloroflexota bacterium]